MPDAKKRVVISCGPIPACLDSVKFLTNRFKGGLAFRTAGWLLDEHSDRLDLTVVAWKYTDVPSGIERCAREVIRVLDVFEYHDWFENHAGEYDAFIMAAAVANLAPTSPYPGKFPSHQYKPGDRFDIEFTIAPRAIDAVKKANPHACLIGYKLFDSCTDNQLIGIARETMKEAKADVIFANRPPEASRRKIAVFPDNSVVSMDFDAHLRMIYRAIMQRHFHTSQTPLLTAELNDLDVRVALATVGMFDVGFKAHGFGTVAVPVANHPGLFATTARGHAGGAVLVRGVVPECLTVRATGKATPNAPALQAMLDGHEDRIVVHRHFDDPLAMEKSEFDLPSPEGSGIAELQEYVFPGTAHERQQAVDLVGRGGTLLRQPFHGYVKALPILPVDWTRYHELFPDKYFPVPPAMRAVIARYAPEDALEVGANDSPLAKYVYDPYVATDEAENLSWEQATSRRFGLVFACNSVNYLSLDELAALLDRADAFVANTFVAPPSEKITRDEASVYDRKSRTVVHTLRLPGDAIMRHSFNVYTADDYGALGLTVETYNEGRSAIVSKGLGRVLPGE